MAINVSCPACGAKRILSDAFRGLSVTCPKCGAKFTATGSTDSLSPGSNPALERVLAEARAAQATVADSATLPPLLDPPPGSDASADLLGDSSSGLSSANLIATPQPAARPPEPTLPPAPPPPAPKAAAPTLPPAETSAPTPARREYKVLTRQNLWLAGEFNQAGLEEALNSYAQQGWQLKSTTVLTVNDPEGSREELIVIMER